MTAILQRLLAAAAAAAASYVTSKLGPEAGSFASHWLNMAAAGGAAYVVAHVFHKMTPPGAAAPADNIGDP